MKKYKNYFMNLIIPAFVFGSITGILTAIAVMLYKVCAKYVISFSEVGYEYLRAHLYFVPLVLFALVGVSFAFAYVYKKAPNLQGGGIPTSIGILRGIITFKWIRSLFGTFFMSLTVFLFGVPLGNEGPSVQMGTAIGRGSVYTLAGRQRAWDRYTMTGGACSGFAVATGAPITGIMFAIEEAHQRLSPMIIIVSSTSVMFAKITTELLAPVLGVSIGLFPDMKLVALGVKDVWIPLAVGIALGLFAVLFLRFYELINQLFTKTLGKIQLGYKIFAVMALTVALGLVSAHFVSTGHELILDIFDGKIAVYMLFLIIFVRSTLTICANSTGITGGMFIPLLALGATLSSLVGKGILGIFGLDEGYYAVILVLGITACISSMMKTPLTAIFFAIEALSCYDNALYVIVCATVSFIITEVFGAKSINDNVLDNRVEEINEGKSSKVIDTFVTVKKNAFAIGKQIRDIFWPANLFVLSLQHDETKGAEVDEHGGKAIREGDVLHVRYSTYDEISTREELTAIVGKQDYDETEADII